MKILILHVFVLTVAYGQDANLSDNCDAVGGDCVSINNCDVIKKFIQKYPSVRHTIKKYHCGFDGDIPKVCCQPDDCTANQLMWGTCSNNFAIEDYLESGVDTLSC